MEPGVVADLLAGHGRAVERATPGDRVLHRYFVGLAQRNREHRVHLFLLLDEPHQLLGRIADLFGCGTEVQEAAQSRRIDGLRACT